MKVQERYLPEEFNEQKIARLHEFGVNKKIPDSIKLQALIALSHFPELKKTKIRFVFTKSQLAFASRPHWKNIVRPEHEWEYLIVLSTKSTKVPDQLLFPNLPFNAQIGILGHELSHTAFYLHKSPMTLVSIGIKYLNWNYRIRFENDTDKETIRRGLGWQLLEFATYCRQHPRTSSRLVKWLNKFYLTPSQIIKSINSIPEYKL